MSDIALVRPWCPEDRSLILHTWHRVYRQQGPRWVIPNERGRDPQYMPTYFYDKAIGPQLRAALDRTGAIVACSKEDNDVVFGFRVGDADVTHFTFVKSPYRRMGIARLLFDGISEEHRYTLSTPVERRLRKRGKLPKSWFYDFEGLWRFE